MMASFLPVIVNKKLIYNTWQSECPLNSFSYTPRLTVNVSFQLKPATEDI